MSDSQEAAALNSEELRVYCGVADAHGIESFMEYPAKTAGIMQLRASMNRQRHAVFYVARLNKVTAAVIEGLLADKQYQVALRTLKEVAAAHGDIGLSGGGDVKASWDQIPNPKLDPWNETEQLEEADDYGIYSGA